MFTAKKLLVVAAIWFNINIYIWKLESEITKSTSVTVKNLLKLA